MDTFKKIICTVLITACLPVPAYADVPADAFVFALDSKLAMNSGRVEELTYAPFFSLGTTYAPLRYTMEAVGAVVDYDEPSHTALIEYDGKDYTYPLKYNSAVLDGVSYIPLRKLCEMLGMQVTWSEGLVFLSHDKFDLSDTEREEYCNILGYTGYSDRGIDYGEPKVKFSRGAGLYENAFELTLSTNADNAKIYYTLDGSEPSVYDYEYTEPISIYDRTYEPSRLDMYSTVPPEDSMYMPASYTFKGTVVKAVAVDSSGERSKVSTATYLVSDDIKSRYGVKVVSISTNTGNFFDKDKGIYVYPNYEKKGSDWERSAYMEVFDKDGKERISQSIGVRINGGFTRRYQQKSLRIYARQNETDLNGDLKKFKYDFFDGEVRDINGDVIDSYKRLILRNSGDDFWSFRIKDPAATRVANNMGLDNLGYSPCVVFLNGEYWGMHEIRERFDENYIDSHYRLESDKDASGAEISENLYRIDNSFGSEEDTQNLSDMMYFVIYNDMTDPENFAKAETVFDLDNFIDYYCFNVFFENNDWPINNVKMWRNTNPDNPVDTKWRWLVTDLDGSFESYRNNAMLFFGNDVSKFWDNSLGGTLGFRLDETPGAIAFMMRSLMKNEAFAAKFEARYRECLNTYFSEGNVSAYLDKIYASIIHLRSEHINRYPYTWSNDNIYPLLQYTKTRPYDALTELDEYFK